MHIRPHAFKLATLALLLVGLACRPVLTVGWQEILILALVIAVLLGPALWRLYRRWAEYQAWRENRRSKDSTD